MLRPHATIDADVLSRSMSTVLFADVVDSVRLVEADEERTIRRWLAFVDQIETELARSGSGRIVKKIGDGLMMEFDDPSQAVRCAIDMRDRLNAGNASWRLGSGELLFFDGRFTRKNWLSHRHFGPGRPAALQSHLQFTA